MTDVASTAAAMVAPGKGILAADESISTMSSRLSTAAVPATEENRRAYREMLVSAPGLASGISGVILCDETIRRRFGHGRPFPAALADLGIMAGIKVDTGAKPLAGAPGETITEGLDGLLPRLHEYASLGAPFAKWRAVLRIGAGTPSAIAVRANAQALARYAAACQEAGLVPIVEHEVLMDGTHSSRPAGTDPARRHERRRAGRPLHPRAGTRPSLIASRCRCPARRGTKVPAALRPRASRWRHAVRRSPGACRDRPGEAAGRRIPAAMNAGHRSVPHTARFEAWAPTRDECFAEAVAALVEGVADTACVSAAGQAQVWIEPLDDDDQLAQLLGEVIRRMNTDAVLPVDVEITQPQGGGLDVRLAVVPLRDVRLTRSLPERVVLTGVSMRPLGGQWFATFTLVLPG